MMQRCNELGREIITLIWWILDAEHRCENLQLGENAKKVNLFDASPFDLSKRNNIIVLLQTQRSPFETLTSEATARRNNFSFLVQHLMALTRGLANISLSA